MLPQSVRAASIVHNSVTALPSQSTFCSPHQASQSFDTMMRELFVSIQALSDFAIWRASEILQNSQGGVTKDSTALQR